MLYDSWISVFTVDRNSNILPRTMDRPKNDVAKKIQILRGVASKITGDSD